MKGLLKATPPKEEPQPYIDCTGNLQVLHKVYSFIFFFCSIGEWGLRVSDRIWIIISFVI